MGWPSAKAFIVLALVLGVAACSKKEPDLMNLRGTKQGPDEFAILPTKPLQQPANFQDLPPPTPGGTNITDPTPQVDAFIALGGRAPATGLRGGEVALVNAAGRYGVSSSIRSELAAEDLNWRRDNQGKVLERLFNVNVYYKAYKAMHLNQHAELERLRLLGIWTPAAPPDPELPSENPNKVRLR